MIAELNLGYQPKVIIMDGVEAFVDGGPSHGQEGRGRRVHRRNGPRGRGRRRAWRSSRIWDRTRPSWTRKIFEQDQIQRAVEIGHRRSAGPEQIEIAAADAAGRVYAERSKPS